MSDLEETVVDGSDSDAEKKPSSASVSFEPVGTSDEDKFGDDFEDEDFDDFEDIDGFSSDLDKPIGEFDEIDPFDEDDECDDIELESDASSISYRNVYKSKILHSERDLYVYNFVEKGIKLSSINPKEVEKNQVVYVEPMGNEGDFSKLTNEHLVVIKGPAHTGKRSAALYFANKLLEAKVSTIWVLRFTENASLVDFLEDDECPENCVFLIHDAFRVPGINSLEIIRHHLQIELLLKNKNNFAVLTTDLSHLSSYDELPEGISAEFNIDKIPNLENVLESHLQYHKLPEGKKLTPIQKKKILSTLHTPYEIDRFCQKLLSDKQEFSTKRVVQILEAITNTELEAKEWFSNLSLNEKYYALLIGLFEDIDSDKLWQIYEKVVKHLILRKVSLEDPYNFSEEELQDATETEINLKNIRYKSPFFRDYVTEQGRSAYRQHFRYLLPVFSELVIEHSEKKETYIPDNTDTRIILASGIGEIGKSSWRQTQPILYEWAKGKERTTRTCVAHALRRKASSDTDFSEVKKTLEHWQKHKNPRIRWTVAASWERLYPYDETGALEKLTQLAEDRNDSINKAVAHALVSISKRDIDKVMNWLLSKMITSESAPVRKTAAYTFSRLLSENRYCREYVADTEKKKIVLPLIVELFKIESKKSIQRGMNILLSWVSLDEVEINQVIENTLIEIYTTSDYEKCLLISQILKNSWKSSTEDHVYRFSVILLDLLGIDHDSSSPIATEESSLPSDEGSLLKGLKELNAFFRKRNSREIEEDEKEPSSLKGNLLDRIKK